MKKQCNDAVWFIWNSKSNLTENLPVDLLKISKKNPNLLKFQDSNGEFDFYSEVTTDCKQKTYRKFWKGFYLM